MTEEAHTKPSEMQVVRETIESLAVAFILALLFKAFIAEAFVIPTGSMAPTLMGAHKDIQCEECGYQYQCGASSEFNDVGARKEELVIGTTRSEQEVLPADASLIDVLRARHERGALRPNRMLLRAAQAHAEQSCRAQQVAHVIDEHGDAQARLLSDHIAARHVGEVVARAEDESAAWRTLAESPSHRLAIGDARFTDVGIGRAEAHGRTCLVVVLAAWPRYVASTR